MENSKHKNNTCSVRGGLRFVTITLALAVLASCSTTPDGNDYADYNDPLESFNRAMFEVNDTLDQAIARPVAVAYTEVVPKPAQTGIRNFLRNLRSPVNIVNQLLQGDIEGFAGDTVRALVNTTVGIGGLIDVADSAGLPYEHEDFGQTLAVWGVGNGPYLVLPIIGPNSIRDHAGMALDTYADPLRLYLFNTDQEEWYYGRLAMTGLDKRAELIDVLDDLRENSLDYYAALRSAHYQHRKALIGDLDGDSVEIPEIPDYDEE